MPLPLGWLGLGAVKSNTIICISIINIINLHYYYYFLYYGSCMYDRIASLVSAHLKYHDNFVIKRQIIARIIQWCVLFGV